MFASNTLASRPTFRERCANLTPARRLPFSRHRNNRPSNPTPNSGPPIARDPLDALGADVFLDILVLLPIPALIVAEKVCSSWRDFSVTNTALWRRVALRERLDPFEVRRADAIADERRKRQEYRCPVFDWRDLCLSLLPAQRAWEAGTPSPERMRPQAAWREGDEFDMDVMAVDRGFLFSSSVNDNSLRVHDVSATISHRPLCRDHIPPHTSLTQLQRLPDAGYVHLAAGGGWVVGMTGTNHFQSPLPIPTPWRVDVWRMTASNTKDGHHAAPLVECPSQGNTLQILQFAGAIPFEPFWGYTMCIHIDREDSAQPNTVLCILTGEARIVDSDPVSPHWVASRKGLVVHLFFLDEGMRVESIPIGDIKGVNSWSISIDDDYIFIPAALQLHIYSRHTRSLVATLDSPPVPALAVAVNLHQDAHMACRTFHDVNRANGYDTPASSAIPYTYADTIWPLPSPPTSEPGQPATGYTPNPAGRDRRSRRSLRHTLRFRGFADVDMPVKRMGDVGFEYAFGMAMTPPAVERGPRPEVARTTSTDLIYTCATGTLFILRGYKDVLARLATMDPELRSEEAGRNTLLVHLHPAVGTVATYHDRVVVITRCRSYALMFDSPDLPTIQCAPSPAPTPNTHSAWNATASPLDLSPLTDSLETKPTPTPETQTHFRARVILGERYLGSGGQVHMDAHEVFMPHWRIGVDSWRFGGLSGQ